MFCFFFYFLANNFYPDVVDQFGRTPLTYCALADRPYCAKILIKAGANVNLKDKGGRTALHGAAQKVSAIYLCN